MTVKYQDYKRFEGKSTITFGDVVDDKAKTADIRTETVAACYHPK